jgi:hypothetical protein
MLFPVVQKDRLRGATKSDLILNELAAEVNLKLVKCSGSGRFLRHLCKFMRWVRQARRHGAGRKKVTTLDGRVKTKCRDPSLRFRMTGLDPSLGARTGASGGTYMSGNPSLAFHSGCASRPDTTLLVRDSPFNPKLQSFYISVTCSNTASGTFHVVRLGRAMSFCNRAREARRV